MSLHPQAAAHLAAVADMPALHQLSVAQARRANLGFLQLQKPPRAVDSVTTEFILGDTADLAIRIYRAGSGNIVPAVLMMHGSGWVTCNIDVCDAPARALALDTGFVVVTVNYQKAPEHPYPQPLDDCVTAFTWMLDHAEELGIDPECVAVMGDSAGGNLAAALCLRQRDAGGRLPAAQVLLYPAVGYDFDTPSHRAHDGRTGLGTDDLRWFWSHYLGGRPVDGYAAPLTAPDLHGLPATYLATAEYDVLRSEGAAYAERLAAAGVPTTYRDYAGMIHGFYWMDRVLDDATSLHREVAEWLTVTLTTSGHPAAVPARSMAGSSVLRGALPVQ